MNWFYSKDGKPAGPVGDEEFEELIASGAVQGSTLVWHSGLDDWQPYSHVRPPGAPLPIRDPAALATSAAAPAAPANALPYAGFWIRMAASALDSLILMPLLTLLYLGFFVAFPDFLSTLAAGGRERLLFETVLLTIAASYETLFVGRYGATPGKMICDLRVVHSDGAKVSYGRALARYFCKGLSGAFFFAGYFLIFLNPQKCALHDFVCDTRVIHTD